jgi:hypothetical protein
VPTNHDALTNNVAQKIVFAVIYPPPPEFVFGLPNAP